MKRLLAVAAVAFAFAVPSAARADFGIRAGLEAPMVTHVSGETTSMGTSSGSTTFNIGDSFQPSLDLLAQFGPSDLIAFGVEGRVNFVSTSNYTRTGTSIGPEAMLNVPILPLYVRASLPIRLEPSAAALGLRVAAGLKLNLPIIGFYLEAAEDLPLAGNDVNGHSQDAFKQQTFSVGLGVEIRL